MTLRLSLAAPGRAEVRIYDLLGRRVRALTAAGTGAIDVAWDGRDETGARVRPGLYLLEARHGGARLARRIARVD